MDSAILIEADLTGAFLTDADLTGADLTDATLTDATLTGVIWDSTLCPDGILSDDNGGICEAARSTGRRGIEGISLGDDFR